MRIQSTVGGAALALASTILASAAAQPAVTQRSSTATLMVPRDIRAILRAHCVICHSPGGQSPMPLVTDEDVLPWAQKIKEQTLARRMPIWHAARGYGAFSNDPTLTPYELELITKWVDAGGQRDVRGQRGAEGAGRAGGAGAAGATGAEVRPPTETSMTVRVWNGWVTGWIFVPGDPLITSATFTSGDGSTVGTWTAGDRTTRLPPESAIRVVSPVHVEIRRREKAGNETAFDSRPSSLHFSRLPPTDSQTPPIPMGRVRIERVACGGTIGPADASLIGVRPLLAAGASAEVTIERMAGAQPALLGWFRDFDPNYPRIYWLDRPVDFVANARLTSDAPCQLDVVLSSPR